MSEEHKSEHDSGQSKGGFVGWIFSTFFALVRSVIYLLGIAWAAGAIYFDAPVDVELYRKILAIAFAVVVPLFLLGLGKPGRRFVGWALVMALVLVPWLMIKPSNQGDWRPPWSRTPWVELEGDTLTFHNFRNFDYGLDGTVTERWEERTVRLSNLRGLDYFHHAFKGDLLAHPILSFDFGEDGQVAFSVEVRYEEGQKFSPLAGLYRQFHLIYLAGDERDFVRERANVRDEPVRLYRASYGPERIRSMFWETVMTMNRLKDTPRFYHTITANCTTSYLMQTPADRRASLDYRLLLNGRLESLLYERGVMVTDELSFEELLDQASINEAAKAAHHDPDFSVRIRAGRPGFGW